MTYNYDPSTGPDLFTTHSDPCKKKPVWYQLFPLNDCPFRVTNCRDPRLRCVFFWQRHVDGITVEQREVSVLFIAQRGEPQGVGTAICRDLPGIKRYLYTSEKKQNGPDHKKIHMGQEFPALQRLSGHFYIVPVVTSFQVSKQQVSSTVLEFFLGPTRWALTSCRWSEIAPFFHPSETQLFSAIYRGSNSPHLQRSFLGPTLYRPTTQFPTNRYTWIQMVPPQKKLRESWWRWCVLRFL